MNSLLNWKDFIYKLNFNMHELYYDTWGEKNLCDPHFKRCGLVGLGWSNLFVIL
jgi:hypothetical protein